MERFKMDRLMENMRLTIKGLKKGIRRLKVLERRRMYSFCFTALKRLAGAGNAIAPNTEFLTIWEWLLIAHGIKHFEWEVTVFVSYV